MRLTNLRILVVILSSSSIPANQMCLSTLYQETDLGADGLLQQAQQSQDLIITRPRRWLKTSIVFPLHNSSAMAGPFTVTVHPFTSPTPFSCAYERGTTSYRNALVFIGGLTSGPHTTPQLNLLIQALEDESELSYSFWEFRMRSSYTGFGYSSLENDSEDIAALVKYLEEIGKEHIVLLGSSTGMIMRCHIMQ